MRKAQKAVVFAFMGLLLVFACGENIPVAEMAKARNAISRAESVLAEKYAQEEFKAAKDRLLQCHDLIVKNKFDDAKKSAAESGVLAKAAYDKAVPLLAKDTLDDADKSLREAEEVYAEKFAPADFEKAKTDYETANTMFEGKEFYPSYKKAVEADTAAKSAYSMSVGKKSVLKDGIDEVRHNLNEALKYDAQVYAPDKVALAKEHISVADEAYGKLELKKCSSAVELAKISADEAYVAAVEGYAKKELVKAGDMVQLAEKNQAAAAKDDIAAAKDSLDKAKVSFTDSKFKESIDQSDDAIRLSQSAMGKKEIEGSDVASITGKGTEPVSGKDAGPAVDKDTVSGKSAGNYVTYKVRFHERVKDCLWRIAQKFYKNPMLWGKIFDANRDIIHNPNLIYPGWVLKIPQD